MVHEGVGVGVKEARKGGGSKVRGKRDYEKYYGVITTREYRYIHDLMISTTQWCFKYHL